ncbi:queuosine precursor transporter [Arenibaculum pallidiluteum]|uniref:queuosine precursor transporter n=1 Tax=Arenibaculum pallidiluteum TaxID=2812559 RepID=UPI001A96981B|nr:queuosine precursor transporter [Arenibaculum pallidiluteum]
MSSPRHAQHSSWFLLIVALFVTCLLVSNVTAVKLVMVSGLVLPAAVVIFPISYIIGDVLTEVYGFARARQVIWLGFLCNLLAVAAFAVGGALPPAPFWEGQEAYQQILGSAPRILAASFMAYLAGELVNAYVLARLKVMTGGRMLWLRTIGSTLVGQLIDSAIFIGIAFAGVMPVEALVAAAVTQWLVKSAFEAVATPVTYAVVAFLKRMEGLDVYDGDTRFSPLPLG